MFYCLLFFILFCFVVDEIQRTIEQTKDNTGMCLTFALNYGGRQDLVGVMQEIAVKIQKNELLPSEITEDLVSNILLIKSVGDPDLIIRTSGEVRLSNFLTWQSAYSEFYFTRVLWPDFDEKDFQAALDSYKGRERRFGHILDL